MSTSLYVSNLPQQFDENDFRDLFRPFGDIERVDIPDRHGRPDLIAYVHFESKDVNACQNAIEKLNGTTFNGKKLKIEISSKQKKQHQPIQRNMVGAPEPAPAYVQRPRAPPTHKSSLLPFQDAEKFYSLPCRMLPVHNGQIDGPQPPMPLNITVPSFERDGTTYSLATTILVNKQPTDALVFLLPLPKKGEVQEFAQNYQGMPQYPPPPAGYPPHPQVPPGQYNPAYPPANYNTQYPAYGPPGYPPPNNNMPMPPPGPIYSSVNNNPPNNRVNGMNYNNPINDKSNSPPPHSGDVENHSSHDDSDSPSWLSK